MERYSIREGAFPSLNVKSAGKMNCGRVKYTWEFILTLCLSELWYSSYCRHLGWGPPVPHTAPCSYLSLRVSCLFLIFSCLGGLESGLQGSEARAYLFLTSVPQHWAQSLVQGRYIWCTQGAPPTVIFFVTLWVV